MSVRSPEGQTATTQYIKNISLGGVFIQMDDPFAFGAEIELEFKLPTAPRQLRCKGFVVWTTKTAPERGGGDEGIGVRLMDIGISDMRLLSEYIEEELKP